MFDFFSRSKSRMPTPEEALPGRSASDFSVPETHFVLRSRILPPYPEGYKRALFGLGCFWGAERLFWGVEGVHTTAVGYAAGFTPFPTYQEVCSGRTGHNEVVLVVWDPAKLAFGRLLQTFWEGHDPTQGMAQGNDTGTQYRSGIYVGDPGLRAEADTSRRIFQGRLSAAGLGEITTEILEMPELYFAEGYHQQYLAKNPGGYCGLGGTGVSCPVGTGA